MKVRFYSILVLLLGAFTLNAQDIHFSQFYAAPLTLNPALTGNFNGLYRITGIYRNQWPGMTGTNPAFSTPSVGVDFSLLREKIKHGSLGVGAVYVNDQMNGKTFSNNTVMASVAYNMGFGERNVFQFGVGLQGGVMFQKVDFSKLRFEDSYDGELNEVPTSADMAALSKGKMKGLFNAGVFFKVEPTKAVRMYVGYSMNNLTRYKQTFLNVSATNGVTASNIGFRHLIHGGFEFDLKDKAVLIPGVLYQTQSKANETNFGLTAGIHVVRDPAKRATIFFGLWNRLNTGNYTVIPKIGFEWKGFRAGFAYDAAVGQQRKDAKAYSGSMAQAFELSLSYVGKIKMFKEDNYLFNPTF